MAEHFCREHGMFHEFEMRDPDCVFEDGFGKEIVGDDKTPPDIPGFEGTMEALVALTAVHASADAEPGTETES